MSNDLIYLECFHQSSGVLSDFMLSVQDLYGVRTLPYYFLSLLQRTGFTTGKKTTTKAQLVMLRGEHG